MDFNNITLELSLKPFKDTSDEGIRRTARVLFQQWLPLCRHAREVAVMLWAADGSEILDYRGNPDGRVIEHSGPSPWVDSFGENQERLAEAQQRG